MGFAMPDDFEVYNDDATTIPAGGLCRPSGGYTDDGALKVKLPDADNQTGLVVASEFAIEPAGVGMGHYSTKASMAFDRGLGVPANGDTLGAQAGSWYAKKGNKGFKCVGGTADVWASVVRSEYTRSPLTTKGDVWGYGATDARVPVGADGQVLTADSAEALGVKWAAGGAGVGVKKSGVFVVPGATALDFDGGQGFQVTAPGGGVAAITMFPASDTLTGVVTTAAQTFGGLKTFVSGIRVRKSSPGIGTYHTFDAAGVELHKDGGDFVAQSGDVVVHRGQVSATIGGATDADYTDPGYTGDVERVTLPIADGSGSIGIQFDYEPYFAGAPDPIGTPDSAVFAYYPDGYPGGPFTGPYFQGLRPGVVGTQGVGFCAEWYGVRSGVSGLLGATGFLGPGAAATGGIITAAGSGSFVGTATANTFTAANTFAIGSAAAVPVTVQGTTGQTANLTEWKNVGGSVVASVSPTGAITAASFTGSGAALTAVPAGQLTGTVDGGTW